MRLRTFLFAIVVSFTGNAYAVDDNNEIWESLRYALFENKPINIDTTGEVLSLKTPKRILDSAVVPISIESKIEQTADRYVEKIWLVVDRNPSPVGAVFTLTPHAGRADIATRIRVQEFTNVRAIARLNDGSIHMAYNFLRAAGGCSAPAGKDMAKAMKNMGRMKLNLWGKPVPGKPLRAQLMVSHPNLSGMAEQSSQAYSSPHFVRHLEVSYAGDVVMKAEVDFTISENPNIRFWFTPKDSEQSMQVKIVDSEDMKFSKTVSIKPPSEIR